MSSSAPDSPYVPDTSQKRQIHVDIPRRFILLPGAAIIFGTTIGLFRGSRRASLRFLAENVHRPPTTVKGWYFYNKTKNYRMIMAGLKEAGADAVKLGASTAGWVCIEEGVKRLGEGFEPAKEVAAGLGTAGIFSLACAFAFTVRDISVRMYYATGCSDSCATDRLPPKAAGQAMFLGFLIGCSVRALQWSQGKLKGELSHRAQEVQAAATESRAEVIEDTKEAVESLTGRKA
jgi:hypothetical protein